MILNFRRLKMNRISDVDIVVYKNKFKTQMVAENLNSFYN